KFQGALQDDVKAVEINRLFEIVVSAFLLNRPRRGLRGIMIGKQNYWRQRMSFAQFAQQSELMRTGSQRIGHNHGGLKRFHGFEAAQVAELSSSLVAVIAELIAHKVGVILIAVDDE